MNRSRRMHTEAIALDDKRDAHVTPESHTVNVAKYKSFMRRHRFAIRDLSLILASMLVLTFLAFEFDIYTNQDGITRHEQTIELDETLTLGGCLLHRVAGLRGEAVSRAEAGDNRRRIAAEQHARELAFQDPLTGLAARTDVSLRSARNAAIAAPPGAGHPTQYSFSISMVSSR